MARTPIEGLAQTLAAFAELKTATQGNVLRRVGRQALAPFDQAWRAKAPHLSGQLEESGSVGSKLSRRQRAAHEKTSNIEVFAGPGANPQAIAQEFGTVTNRPQPYARPAWDETEDQVLDGVKNGLGLEVSKAAGRQARKAAKLAGSR